MTDKPLEQILNEKKRQIELQQSIKGTVPFDIKYRKEVGHFNTLCDRLKTSLASQSETASAKQVTELFTQFTELRKYADSAGIADQQAVISNIADVKNRIDEKRKKDHDKIKRSVAHGNESLSEVAARLYDHREERDFRKAEQKIVQGGTAIAAWGLQDNELGNRLQELEKICVSFDETRARIDKILKTYHVFEKEISSLGFNVHGQADAMYLIAEEHAKTLDFKAIDVNILLDKLGITCEYSSSDRQWGTSRDKNTGLQGIFSSALINTHSISEVCVYTIENPFCFYRAKNMKIIVHSQNSADHTLENIENCEVELIWNSGGAIAGTNAKDSKWKVGTNTGTLLYEAEDCELEIHNVDLPKNKSSLRSVLYGAKKCKVEAENVSSDLLHHSEDCEVEIKRVAEKGRIGSDAKGLNAVIEANQGELCACSKNCTIEVKTAYEKSRIGSHAKDINAVISLGTSAFLKNDEDYANLNLFTYMEGGKVIINCGKGIVRPYALFGHGCRDVVFELDPTVPFRGAFEGSKNCKIKMRNLGKSEQIGSIEDCVVIIETLNSDLPKTRENCKFYITQSRKELGIDERVWLMQNGEYVNIKEEHNKKKAEEDERITKLSFWHELQNYLSRADYNIRSKITVLRRKEYILDVVVKGLLWNKKRKHTIRFSGLAISENGAEITAEPTFNYNPPDLKKNIIEWQLGLSEMKDIKERYALEKQLQEQTRQLCSIYTHIFDTDVSSNSLQDYRTFAKNAEQCNAVIARLEKTFPDAEFSRTTDIGRIVAKLRAEPDFSHHYAEFRKQGSDYITALAS